MSSENISDNHAQPNDETPEQLIHELAQSPSKGSRSNFDFPADMNNENPADIERLRIEGNVEKYETDASIITRSSMLNADPIEIDRVSGLC